MFLLSPPSPFSSSPSLLRCCSLLLFLSPLSSSSCRLYRTLPLCFPSSITSFSRQTHVAICPKSLFSRRISCPLTISISTLLPFDGVLSLLWHPLSQRKPVFADRSPIDKAFHIIQVRQRVYRLNQQVWSHESRFIFLMMVEKSFAAGSEQYLDVSTVWLLFVLSPFGYSTWKTGLLCSMIGA